MDDVIAGSRNCASSAIMIGRETFAPGNIGVFWGARFRNELLDTFNGDLDVQGIHREDYPANLVDYHIGGSDTGADSCARTIEQYAAKCPDSKIFVSGYSLVAYKCVNRVSDTARKQIKALVVFGSEEILMDDVQPVPEGITLKNYCVENTTAPDVVCTTTLTSGIDLPNSVGEVVSQLKDSFASLKDVATNEDQLKEVASIPGLLLTELPAALPWIAKDIAQGKIRRWMILPPHMVYGLNGMTTEAAAWMASVASK
ncbi:uncharacterized protein N0V89_006938 [Didymosphaeria variabile]|uniref:cutinase n=1 Tax=Didymosphaeria variabile TaxID=1932322 RepID=A0A9W9C9P9_9PLEO|nr:uncharacterized protein N0V89_006938 [Didymosphaeria variabile]KAJ4351595.1 hypothetical protein N0V89_006938 [Didymosphaeria variabile]